MSLLRTLNLILGFGMLLYSSSVFSLDPDRALSQYNVNEWGVDQQLPQITVTALVQDSTGYIWVGTMNGLARFNGKEFAVFNGDNSEQFKSNIIVDLMIDSVGSLWVLTTANILKLTASGFEEAGGEVGSILRPNQIIEFNSEILVSTNKGVFVVSESSLIPYQGLEESYAMAKNEQHLLVGGRGYFTQVYPTQRKVVNLPNSFNKSTVNAIQAIGSSIWLATSSGLLLYADGEFINIENDIPLSKEPTKALYLDENEILWVATDIASYRIRNGKLHKLNKELKYPRVTVHMRDKDSTLWLGTSDRGLFHLWDSWVVRYNEHYGISENLVWSVAKDSTNKIIVGSDKAVYKMNDGQFEPLVTTEQLPNPSVYSLFVDSDDSIWVGTKGGVGHYDKNGTRINSEFEDIRGLQVNAVLKDRREDLWILTNQGVFKFDGNTVIQVDHNTRFAGASFRTAYELNGFLYLGTQSGLLTYDPDQGLKAVLDSRLQTFITAINEVEGDLVVGTFAEGLFILKDNHWTNLNVKSGLVFNNSFSINPIGKSLWISGIDGVYKIPKKDIYEYLNKQAKKVNAEPILNDSGYLTGSQKAYCCNGAGHGKSTVTESSIWFPTRKGLIELEINKVKKNQTLVPVVIESLNVGGIKFDMTKFRKNTHGHGKMALDRKDINFSFIGLTSFDEGLVNYRYRLIGYSDNWINIGSKRTAHFTNLPAGDYVFEVMASNNNGLWAREPTKFTFNIQPLYFETLWFKALLLIVVTFTIYLIFVFVSYRNRKKVLSLESIVDTKTKALQIANEQLAEANNKLSILSYTDPLTGAFNRRYLVKQISSDIAHYARAYKDFEDEKSLVFLVADLDFFKEINDRYGHLSGDKILKAVVDILKENIRDGDYLVRWGGEEFLIVLRPNHVASIEDLCTRLIRKIGNKNFSGNHGESISLTLSIGYCFYPLAANTDWIWEKAIDVADNALYQAKNNGRNQWVGYQLLPNAASKLDSSTEEIDLELFQRYSGK